MKHWFGNSLRGVCMGLADVIPGVSGGTVALILGIYPRLITAVGSVGAGMLRRLRMRSFRALLKEGFREPARLGDASEGAEAGHILLMASVVAGVVPAILAGAQILPPLLSSHPEQMRGLFLGLVLASVTIPARQIGRRSASRWILACVAALLTAWFAGLPEPSTRHAHGSVTLEFATPLADDIRLTPGNLTLEAPAGDGHPAVEFGLSRSRVAPAGATSLEVEVVARAAGAAGNLPAASIRAADGPVEIAAVSQPEALTGGRDPSLAYVFVGGALAISAMVLPGISGSFVLLLLGLYSFVLHSLALALQGDLRAAAVVATMLAAMAFGLLTFTRILKALFARWREATLAVLVGLMVGSLRKLWPFMEQGEDGSEVLVLPIVGDTGTLTVLMMFAVGVGAVVVLDRAGRRAGSGIGTQ
ncbi:MAG: DUF368 domain-containing protein [Gemmatimonadetes bacterium]|nr:DUF368 domain-containing protein [Gemmatimonadota bacterium]